MSFKVKALGFAELDRKFQALGRLVSPQVGVAESLSFGAEVIRIMAMDNAVAQGLIESGALIDSIVTVKVNQYRTDVRVAVPYGAIHEYGGTVTITEKQRGFFWAMWIKTNDPMWKALALSETYTIKARSYVRPAIDEGKRLAGIETARAFREQLKEVLV